jgi:tyrosyl-tRNA synthetase
MSTTPSAQGLSFIDELTWRGLVHQSTDPGLGERMRQERLTLYCGFDPTAESLHVGSLLPITVLMRAQRAGHRPIALVGGATGMVGDPSFKAEERKLLDNDALARNVEGIRSQLSRFIDFSGEGGALLVNNADWMAPFSFLSFLRDVGKHFTVNAMLAKESVRARLEDREHGISYTEFSYMLLQAYDFVHLHDAHGCTLQVGGSDQWGNITAGIELLRRMRGKQAYGVTMPLITTAAGHKFGKTEKGAVWLDAARTSPYDFHQFFLRTDDKDVGRFLRYYTFLDEPTLQALDEQVQREPQKREAQKVLAREVTALVHGKEEAQKAEETAQALFAGKRAVTKVLGVTADAYVRLPLVIPPGAPSTEVPRAELEGMALVELLARCGLAGGKGAARRDIEGGGISLNEERVADPARTLSAADLQEGGVLLLRKGKKTYHVVRGV